MTEREFATSVVRTLQEAGHTAYFAGGSVRDELLGLTPADYDVATDATPPRVQTLFKRTIAVGAAFGVIDVLGPKINGEYSNVQVATFRSDGTYTDGRRPDSIRFGTAPDDAARRDFTINGMFKDPITNTVHDFIGGKQDLDTKLLRAIGNPATRFEEDRLRVLRAVRLAARFSLTIEPATQSAAILAVPYITAVSAERIADELRRILAHSTRANGFALAVEFGLIAKLFPEVAEFSQHTVTVLKVLPLQASFELAFAVVVMEKAQSARALCHRLKLSNAETDHVMWLTQHRNALSNASTMLRSQFYPLLAHPGIRDLLALMAAEGQHPESIAYCEKTLEEVPYEQLNPPPILTGDDLIQLGMKPGKDFKTIIEATRVAQLDGHLATTAEAVANLSNFLSNRFGLENHPGS